jgi:ABC-type branched-subunit amino acid transport system substrate-binding protein
LLSRLTILILAAVALPPIFWRTDAASSGARLTEREKRGKQIYLRGTSPSGRAMVATMGDAAVEVPASTLPCAGCHGYDGKGRPEGGVTPTNVTWPSLTVSYGHRHEAGRAHPPFDELSLERALVEGVDPAGQPIPAAMPRYQMAREDMADLIAYLKRLDEDRDPGVGENLLTLGTLLPASGPSAEIGDAMRAVLTAYFAEVNAQGGIYGRRIELKAVSLAGNAETAAQQARRFVTDENVFALVGAMTAGAERELTALAEDEAVPLIGPFTLFPQAASPPPRQTFYVYAGWPEQARALISFAARRFKPAETRVAVVTVEGERESEFMVALEDDCRKVNWLGVARHRYAKGHFDAARLVSELKQHHVAAVFFLGAGGDEKALLEEAAKHGYAPHILLPGSRASRETFALLPNSAAQVSLAYPTLPADQSARALAGFRALLAAHGVTPRHAAAQWLAYSAAKLLVEGLRRSGRELSREKLVTTLEGFYEFDTGLTPRLTYGPNRRVGALGAYVVTFDPRKKDFEPTGGWINLN